MNKNKFTEFFKGKGYYVLLFIGVMAIAAVAVIGSQLSSGDTPKEQEFVDLNETEDNIGAGEDTELAENNPVSEGIVNNADSTSGQTAANDIEGQDVATNTSQAELEGYEDNAGAATDTQTAAADTTGQAETASSSGQTETANADGKTDETAQAEEEAAAAVETTGSSVQADTTAADNLSFSTDEGLLWPVSGNVLMNYSMDHTIYFATLMQYKCNPAVVIGAEVGTEVKAAADGVVTNIEVDNAETGFTITMAIGDGYSVVYGQLNKEGIALKVGDSVKEGDIIGTIAEPTKYYTVEGSNLYFQVMENEEAVNPMLLLRNDAEE